MFSEIPFKWLEREQQKYLLGAKLVIVSPESKQSVTETIIDVVQNISALCHNFPVVRREGCIGWITAQRKGSQGW